MESDIKVCLVGDEVFIYLKQHGEEYETIDLYFKGKLDSPEEVLDAIQDEIKEEDALDLNGRIHLLENTFKYDFNRWLKTQQEVARQMEIDRKDRPSTPQSIMKMLENFNDGQIRHLQGLIASYLTQRGVK